jgi:viroplasmin
MISSMSVQIGKKHSIYRTMAKKKNFYVVFNGREPGVYDDWEDCRRQVDGYSNHKYEGFDSKQAAEKAYADFQKANPDPIDAMIDSFEKDKDPSDTQPYIDGLDSIGGNIDIDDTIRQIAGIEQCEMEINGKIKQHSVEAGIMPRQPDPISPGVKQTVEQEIEVFRKANSDELPTPSTPEQQKVASVVSAIDEKLATIQIKKIRYEELRKGLVKQYFD